MPFCLVGLGLAAKRECSQRLGPTAVRHMPSTTNLGCYRGVTVTPFQVPRKFQHS